MGLPGQNMENKCALPDGTFCSLCCHLEIDDVQKDGTPLKNSLYMPCRELCGGQCADYDIRPDTCREFDCHAVKESKIKMLLFIAAKFGLNSSNLPPLQTNFNSFFRPLR